MKILHLLFVSLFCISLGCGSSPTPIQEPETIDDDPIADVDASAEAEISAESEE